MDITFEYCALRYLNQWLEKDKHYFETLSQGTKEEKLSNLREAGGFYGIARNLRKKYDEGKGFVRYEPILEILNGISTTEITPINLSEKVGRIESEISRKYGDRKVLSATTKFLWLKVRNPVIIYDKRVRDALGTSEWDYQEFILKWNESYRDHLQELEEICSKLFELDQYTINPNLATPDYIKSLSQEEWFTRRVFDIYLLMKG